MEKYELARSKEETRLYMILHAPGDKSEPVTGSAWLHEMARNLSDAGTDRCLDAPGFVFFSPSLQAIVDRGIASGMMRQDGARGSLHLTGDGLRVARDLWARAPPSERLHVSSAKEFFNDMTYAELCAFARAEFPDANPAIRGELDSERTDAAVSLLGRQKVSVSKAVAISGLSESDFFKELEARGVSAYSIDKSEFDASLARIEGAT